MSFRSRSQVNIGDLICILMMWLHFVLVENWRRNLRRELIQRISVLSFVTSAQTGLSNNSPYACRNGHDRHAKDSG